MEMATIERRILYQEHGKNDYCEDDSICACSLQAPSDLFCTCGEEYDMHEWAWDEQVASQATLLSKQNREVRFHPGYSSGTAAVRGDSPFKQGNVYYWEIKMLTSLYGTDVMVGVGTKRAELDKSAYQFCSLLGSDKESWGFSYTGRLHHNGKTEWYGPPFGKGSIIGIYLDMWQGTLEFFLNRRPLGIAFRSLQSNILYPMVCSTAAQSAMRVTLSASLPVSLKLLSLQALKGDRDAIGQLLCVPGLRNYVSSCWWLPSGEDCDMSGLERVGVRGGLGGGGPLILTGRKRAPHHHHCPHQPPLAPHERRRHRLCMTCDIIL